MRFLNYVSYVTVGVTFIVTGIAETTAVRFHHQYLARELPDHPLPGLTLSVMAFAQSHALLYLNIFSGIIFSSLLFYLDCGPERRRAFVPFCLTFALIACLVQLLTVFIAMTLPHVTLSLNLPIPD